MYNYNQLRPEVRIKAGTFQNQVMGKQPKQFQQKNVERDFILNNRMQFMVGDGK